LLQLFTLSVFILREQGFGSLTKRMRAFMGLGLIGLSVLAFVPPQALERLVTYGTTKEDRGHESLRNRINTDFVALEIALKNPLLGVGIGNFRWARRLDTGYGRPSKNHNSYLWALTSGGIGVLALYLLLFYRTHQALRQIEKSGPSELLWLSKAFRVNLILFLIFSAFADFWHSDFMYFLVAQTICMTMVCQRQRAREWRTVPRAQVQNQYPPKLLSTPAAISS
jgi:O-antigen ligase